MSPSLRPRKLAIATWRANVSTAPRLAPTLEATDSYSGRHFMTDSANRLRPVPQRVEFLFFVELDSDHHPVGHTFSSNIVIVPVGDVRQRPVGILPGCKEDRLGLRIPMEQLSV